MKAIATGMKLRELVILPQLALAAELGNLLPVLRGISTDRFQGD